MAWDWRRGLGPGRRSRRRRTHQPLHPGWSGRTGKPGLRPGRNCGSIRPARTTPRFDRGSRASGRESSPGVIYASRQHPPLLPSF